MLQIFLQIINMSISASYIVLAVLLLRLLLTKAPKGITVFLWGIVAVRLICPFSVESVLSLIPSAEVISPDIMMDSTPEINTGIPIINQVINPIIRGSFTLDPLKSETSLPMLILIFTVLWIVGIVALLIYMVVSYARVRRKIGTAVIYKDNIYQSENVISPFVFGIINPKIYLPFNMNEQNMKHVVAHELAHIRRKDHLWKSLGFIVLTIHWFNPLMWFGFILFGRDIEFACDEKVIKELDHDARADYSETLLACSVNRQVIAACPLAFSEVGVKERVKSVLNYKKPAFWIIIVAVVSCMMLVVCFLTNPMRNSQNPNSNLTNEYTHESYSNIPVEENIDDKTEFHNPDESDAWIVEPTVITFPESEDPHLYLEPYYIQTYTVENDSPWGRYVYHRVFRICHDCEKVIEATEHYLCQYNNTNCKGGCLEGR